MIRDFLKHQWLHLQEKATKNYLIAAACDHRLNLVQTMLIKRTADLTIM